MISTRALGKGASKLSSVSGDLTSCLLSLSSGGPHSLGSGPPTPLGLWGTVWWVCLHLSPTPSTSP